MLILHALQGFDSSLLSLNSQVNSVLPTFMADRKFFTPSFVVFRDQVLVLLSKEYYQANLKFECSKFEEKVLRAEKTC